MKKLVSCLLLMMLAMSVSAMVQMRDYAPPEQSDGYELVATMTVDNVAVVSFNQQFNIVDLQTPVTPDMEAGQVFAQVVDAFTAETPSGQVSMTLVAYLWPNEYSEKVPVNNKPTANYIEYRRPHS